MYDQSGIGPRMMWLDEAFDGVDPDNRATMLRLLTSCDLDWLIAGPGPIANAATVPSQVRTLVYFEYDSHHDQGSDRTA